MMVLPATSATRSRWALTVAADSGCVEEEDCLVDDTTTGATSADKPTAQASGAAGHEGHDTIDATACSLQGTA